MIPPRPQPLINDIPSFPNAEAVVARRIVRAHPERNRDDLQTPATGATKVVEALPPPQHHLADREDPGVAHGTADTALTTRHLVRTRLVVFQLFTRAARQCWRSSVPGRVRPDAQSSPQTESTGREGSASGQFPSSVDSCQTRHSQARLPGDKKP